MKHIHIALFLYFTGSNLMAAMAHAADEDVFLGQIRSPSEQTMGQGQSALWTLPHAATQYQPLQATPEMQAALQAQQEGRFLDALILLDDAGKGARINAETKAEMDMLRASFLLQGNQTQQAIKLLAPLLANTRYAADAYALTAMGHLQQGHMQNALDAAQRARDFQGGLLPHLALSYALQGTARLEDAYEAMRGYNSRTPQSAIALAREAELALTINQIHAARTLIEHAQGADAEQPYVIAVRGLVYLIDGHAREAKSAFETALQHNPKDARALLGLGLAEIKQGNYQAGQRNLQAANEADPGNALTLTYLGRAQQQLGQTDAARASWRSAQQADPKDPTPWLYQAQAELQENHPLAARDSLREAQARTSFRSVYRGERLLEEDTQLLQANLAEVQRSLGLDKLAFQTLADAPGEKSSANLRNQADVLQGQRFGESARRSLLLQSLFNDRPGNLPSELDIFGDGAGQTGAQVPQHGAVSMLGSQQASYNNYDELFTGRTTLAVDATAGSQNTSMEQIRLATVIAGSDTLWLNMAGLKFKTDGNAPYTNLDNSLWQGVMQWQPARTTQAFLSYHTFNSQHGEIRYPADPFYWGEYSQIEDDSSVTRLGLRHSLTDSSELRGLISRQQTSQTNEWEWMSDFLPQTSPFYTVPQQGVTYGTYHNSSKAHSAELQYRRSGSGYAMLLGASSARSPLTVSSWGADALTNVAQQIYVDWQQALNPYWQLEAGLAWGKNDKLWSNGDTHLRRWLPRLGAVYAPDSATHVRLAAWKALDAASVGGASLAPASLAGIVLNRPGDTYKLVQSVVLGADKQLGTAWLLEGQTQRRWTDEPVSGAAIQGMNRNQVGESRLALHWQPRSHALNVTLAYDDEHLQNDPDNLLPNSIQEQHLRSQRLEVHWLASARWTANLAWSRNRVAALQDSSLDNIPTPTLLDIQERFNQTDASLSWQFSRKGTMDIGVRNATDRNFQYTEIDPLIPRFSKGRLAYARLQLAW